MTLKVSLISFNCDIFYLIFIGNFIFRNLYYGIKVKERFNNTIRLRNVLYVSKMNFAFRL